MKAAKKAPAPVKDDPTAVSRSSVRRRASIHSRRNTREPRVQANMIALGFEPSAATSTAQRHGPRSRRNNEDSDRIDNPSATVFGNQSSDRLAATDPTHAATNSEIRMRLNRRRNDLNYNSPPGLHRERPQSRAGELRTTNLPTPPLDISVLPSPSEILARGDATYTDSLSLNPRALSPDNGLGDRRTSRSPTAEDWQVMHATITPDDSLPSTSSSFTTAAAANLSFNRQPDRHDQGVPPEDSTTHDMSNRDVSFEDTMREMGIEVSSSSPTSSSSDDENSASNPEDVASSSHDSDTDSDNYNANNNDETNQATSSDSTWGDTGDEHLEFLAWWFLARRHALLTLIDATGENDRTFDETGQVDADVYMRAVRMRSNIRELDRIAAQTPSARRARYHIRDLDQWLSQQGLHPEISTLR